MSELRELIREHQEVTDATDNDIASILSRYLTDEVATYDTDSKLVDRLCDFIEVEQLQGQEEELMLFIVENLERGPGDMA